MKHSTSSREGRSTLLKYTTIMFLITAMLPSVGIGQNKQTLTETIEWLKPKYLASLFLILVMPAIIAQWILIIKPVQ